MKAEQALIPKDQLPECSVGETLKITGEDDKGNFIVEPEYEEADSPEEASAEGESPEASKGKMGMGGHAPAIAVIIGGKRGARK